MRRASPPPGAARHATFCASSARMCSASAHRSALVPRRPGTSRAMAAAWGEPLCPGLGFDREWADRTRAAVGSYWWYALYQQRPRPPEGLLFKRRDFRYWHEEKADGERLYVLERDTGPHPVGAEWCTIFQT